MALNITKNVLDMSGTDSEDEYYYREVRRKDGKSKSIEVRLD